MRGQDLYQQPIVRLADAVVTAYQHHPGMHLEVFVHNDFRQLGAAHGQVATAGLPVGSGLSQKAAEELGLLPGTPVGSAVIDAYARGSRFPQIDG